jgi:hypothetical protein
MGTSKLEAAPGMRRASRAFYQSAALRVAVWLNVVWLNVKRRVIMFGWNEGR